MRFLLKESESEWKVGDYLKVDEKDDDYGYFEILSLSENKEKTKSQFIGSAFYDYKSKKLLWFDVVEEYDTDDEYLTNATKISKEEYYNSLKNALKNASINKDIEIYYTDDKDQRSEYTNLDEFLEKKPEYKKYLEQTPEPTNVPTPEPTKVPVENKPIENEKWGKKTTLNFSIGMTFVSEKSIKIKKDLATKYNYNSILKIIKIDETDSKPYTCEGYLYDENKNLIVIFHNAKKGDNDIFDNYGYIKPEYYEQYKTDILNKKEENNARVSQLDLNFTDDESDDTYKFDDVESCDGDCINGQNATQKLKNGIIYTGTFKNGRFNGKGLYEDPSRGIKISGRFVNGELDGNGSIRFTSDNTKYIGYLSSTKNISKILYSDLKQQSIPDIIEYHTDLKVDGTNQNVFYNFSGEVYYLKKDDSKKLFENAKITVTNIRSGGDFVLNLESPITTNTDKNGKFNLKLKRGVYKVEVLPNNEYFSPFMISELKLYNDINKNIILKRSKGVKEGEIKSDDLISTGVLTMFNNPVKFEKKIYKKSKTKEEYCKRFTNYYYRAVIEKGGELSTINNDNLKNSKNFIINCYQTYKEKYDEEIKNKINTLMNLAGNIEIFEL